MRTIDRSTKFKRDYKRELKGQHQAILGKDLPEILIALANDEPLESRDAHMIHVTGLIKILKVEIGTTSGEFDRQ